jgi:hypothetical protein
MSLLKRIVGKRGGDQTAPNQATAPDAKRSIDPAKYGFVPAADVRDDHAGPWPDADLLDREVAAGNWQGISTFLEALPATSERRFAALARLGNAAADDDAWLNRWLAAEPSSVNALSIQAEALVGVAWNIRTGDKAENVAREQWAGFFRVLQDVPAVCRQAAEIDPADPAPWIVLQNGALGLQWTNEEYRKLWTEVSTRAPYSFTATHRAWNYWRPRWFGSLDLLDEFLDTALAGAPRGSILTMTRIQALYDEFRPAEADQRAFYRSERMNQALDAGLADAAASDPAHVKLPYLRHWLAYLLWHADRDGEAVEQFQAIGGYCGAEPWNRYKNPKAKFCETRAHAVLTWEDAGRPGPRRGSPS